MVKRNSGSKIVFIVFFILIIFCVIFFGVKYIQDKSFDEDKAIDVIKMYIKSEDEHNVEKAKKYILNTRDNLNSKILEKDINSIKTIKFISAEKAKTKYKPKYYTMKDGKKNFKKWHLSNNLDRCHLFIIF